LFGVTEDYSWHFKESAWIDVTRDR